MTTKLTAKRNNKISGVNVEDLRSEFMTPFDRIFDDFFKGAFPSFQSKYGVDFFEKGSYPKVDIISCEDSIRIEAAIPGMSREDITLDIHDGVLTISGEKRSESKIEGTYIQKELKRSSFRRSWTLRDDLNQDNISASFEDGMLYISIPRIIKKEVVKPRKIEIS